jgi:hypothetical protein
MMLEVFHYLFAIEKKKKEEEGENSSIFSLTFNLNVIHNFYMAPNFIHRVM